MSKLTRDEIILLLECITTEYHQAKYAGNEAKCELLASLALKLKLEQRNV
jgi:hypothetical protein